MTRSLYLLAFVGVLATAYRRVLHPWQERWGARDEELIASLPGDDLIAEPAGQVTRAIEIAAPREGVWPWVIQLGADRGGFYSYDWLENLFRLDIHSADRIVPEWQERAVGDLVHADAKGDYGWYVMDVRPPTPSSSRWRTSRRVVRSDVTTRRTWSSRGLSFLNPNGESSTRLLVRERVAFGKRLAQVAGSPVGLISFVMTQKMMRRIKRRAETPTKTARPH